MAKVVRAVYEKGVIKPLEPLNLREGEVILVAIQRPVRELFGILRKRNPRVRPEDVERVIEEVKDAGDI